MQSPFGDAFEQLVNQAIELLDDTLRFNQAFITRIRAALLQITKFSFNHPNNGDEQLYANRNYIGNYTKALQHDGIGEVISSEYRVYLGALQTGNFADFEPPNLSVGPVKLTDPQAAYAFELEGADSHGLEMPAAPAFSSAQEISEIAEVYWQALTRDVPFTDYDSNELTNAATTDLSRFADFRGPKVNNQVTTGTLFRGDLPGDLIGPYLSQFLWLDVPVGIAAPFPMDVPGGGPVPVPLLSQRKPFAPPGQDFITDYQEWLNIQNGQPAPPPPPLDEPRYIHTSRDLAEFVHRDYPYLTFVNACLILLSYGPDALDPANPYLNAKNQKGFGTFGASDILDLVARVANEALKAAWYQKWLVHRRLRPEEFGGWLENERRRIQNYPFDPQERPKLDFVLERVFDYNRSKNQLRFGKDEGSYLLPQAFPEGCPTHPAYPSGHATYAGACVTVLKSFFNEDFMYSLDPNDDSRPTTMVANENGTALLPYLGPDILTVGGELNKLASNIAIARDAAGVHWRTDASEGLKLGEQVAICLLQDRVQTYREDFPGYTLTKFNKQKICINQDGTITNL